MPNYDGQVAVREAELRPCLQLRSLAHSVNGVRYCDDAGRASHGIGCYSIRELEDMNTTGTLRVTHQETTGDGTTGAADANPVSKATDHRRGN